MEKQSFIVKHKEIFFLYLIFIVGITGHLIYSFREIMLQLTSATLLITGLVVFYFSLKTANKNFIYWAIITYIITFMLEVIGVKTGIVFGNYNYGSTLGIKIFAVPLMIGFNWVFVILGSISISKCITKNILLAGLLAACFSLLFDFALEPIAIKLNYWNWNGVDIPLQNYLAWFAIAFAASLLFALLKVQIKSSITIHYLVIQFVFFVILFLFYK
jgi:putative membrane protein